MVSKEQDENQNAEPVRKPKKRFFANVKSNVNEKFRSVGSRIRTTDFTLVRTGMGKAVLQPKFIRKDFFDVPRSAQWMAALLLPIIILVSLAIITAVQQTIETVLLNSGDLGNQSAIFGFVATLIGFGLFILGAWSWFLWVRTGGFKLFDH